MSATSTGRRCSMGMASMVIAGVFLATMLLLLSRHSRLRQGGTREFRVGRFTVKLDLSDKEGLGNPAAAGGKGTQQELDSRGDAALLGPGEVQERAAVEEEQAGAEPAPKEAQQQRPEKEQQQQPAGQQQQQQQRPEEQQQQQQPEGQQQEQQPVEAKQQQGAGAQPPAGKVFRCEDSGYCSVGKVQTWRGDVSTNGALRDMLASLSFKNEIILTLLGSGGGLEAQLAVNLALSALDLGLAHFFILGRHQSVCESLPPAFSNISCVWDSRPEALPDPEDPLPDGILERRWELASRMLRMGFNVLSIDTDSMLHHDPYVFLKQGPLSRYSLLAQKDGSDHGSPGTGFNCGVMYWQKAHPGGPSTWATVEHADRAFRQRENVTAMNEVYPGWHVGYSWEQVAWPEMVASVATGLPKMMTVENLHPTTSNVTNSTWEAVMLPSGWEKLECKDVEWPPEWHHVTGRATWPVCSIDNLLVPRPPDDSWWRDNVRWFFSSTRGQQSEQFMELVRTAGKVPFAEMDRVWEAPEPPMPPEHFAYLPGFFAISYAARGIHGYFGAVDPPAQVASHLVYLPGDKAWKTYLFRGQGWWHWEVTEAFSGGNVLGLSEPKLLMLAPAVQLRTATEEQFAQEVAKLVRLAEALGRTLVVPNVPCDSDWVGVWTEDSPWFQEERRSTNLSLWDVVLDGMQVLQLADPLRPGRTYCHWQRFVTSNQCIGQVTMHSDVVAYLKRSLQEEQAQPTQANTLYYHQWVGAGGLDAEGPAAELLAVEEPDVASISTAVAAAGMADAPVLFLGAVPQFRSDGTLPALPTWAEGCHPLIPEVKFDKNEEAQQNKQALLKKMRAGDSVNGGGGEAARRRSLMGGEAVRRRRRMEMVPVFG